MGCLGDLSKVGVDEEGNVMVLGKGKERVGFFLPISLNKQTRTKVKQMGNDFSTSRIIGEKWLARVFERVQIKDRTKNGIQCPIR